MSVIIINPSIVLVTEGGGDRAGIPTGLIDRTTMLTAGTIDGELMDMTDVHGKT